MSWQQSLTSRVFLLVAKAASARGAQPAPPQRAAPPRSLRRRMPVRAERIAETPCFWLGEPSDAAIVYLHGGSYAHQAVGLQWNWIAAVSRASGVPAVFVDYALSGEQPFPIARDQTLAVIAALRERGVRRIILAGDSAGGGLAVSTALSLRDRGMPADAMILVSPWLDLTLADPAAVPLEAADIMLTIAGLRDEGLAYAGGADPRDPGASPLYGSPAGLPPTILHVGDAELFLPDDTNWAAAVEAAGGEIELHVIPRGFHVSAVVQFLPEGRRAVRQQAAFLQRLGVGRASRATG